MATAVDKNTNVEVEIEKTNKLRNIYGYTSNKFGRVVLVNLATYNNMILNNDTLRDKNGLNDRFANLEGAELKAVTKAVKTSDKKDVEKANKIIAKKVSTLNNFMDKYEEGVISNKKTNLVDGILELLEKTSGSTINNSEELKAKDAEIKAGNTKIAELEKDLEEAKKVAPKTTDEKSTKIDDEGGEDSPFDK